MQLLFGVLGDGPQADAIFARLAAASAASAAGLAPEVETAPGWRIGSVARSSASWHEPGPGRRFHLDGEIHAIDGVDTTAKGTGEADRASLARLFDARGPAWDRLDGSFCLLVRDGDASHLAIDVVGARAVYWWLEDGVLAFHSHLRDLAAAIPGTLSEDLGAIGGFLECGRYLPGETPWRQIRHLGAGQALAFADGRATQRDHYAMVFEPDRAPASDDRAVDEVIGLLEASIGRSWRNAARPVLPLSGGVDSRYIAAELVRRNGRGSVPTITWGEEPGRPGGDAEVAARVATALGLEHTWFEKSQRHAPATFARAVYLASGEGDCAIHYPDDHGLHAELAGRLGYGSLFRGDECFGTGGRLITDGGVLAENGLAPIALDDAYRTLLGDDVFDKVAAQQSAALHAVRSGLRSPTPTSRRGELWYAVGVRRFLGPYNRVKVTDLDVCTPLLDRAVLDRLLTTPDRLRSGKSLLRAALARRFPELAAVPYATDDNLPRWDERAATDPSLARFLRDRCSQPGWLDTIGARDRVLGALADLEARATGVRPVREDSRPPSVRAALKRTWPGRLARELTLERRFAANLPSYLRLARLTVLHELLAS